MKKELILSVTKKDLDITYFSGTGAGGQHRNKHQNCCRIKHPPTGIIVTGTKQKSKIQNQRQAIRSLANHPKFITWLKVECSTTQYEKDQIEKKVEEMMFEKNLKVEYI